MMLVHGLVIVATVLQVVYWLARCLGGAADPRERMMILAAVGLMAYWAWQRKGRK